MSASYRQCGGHLEKVLILVLGVVCLLSAGMTGEQHAVGGVGKGAERFTFVNGSFCSNCDRNRLKNSNGEPLKDELNRGYRLERDPDAF